jgi:quercetin dioxygenase-like cupin family protein
MRKTTALRSIAFLALLFGFGTPGDAARPYSQDVKIIPLLNTSVTWTGQALTSPKTDKPEATMLSVTIPAGTETGWHIHPIQGYAYLLSGRLTIETKNGSREFHAGQALAEPVNVPHNGKNLGTEPVKLIVLFTGKHGQPYAARASSQGTFHRQL